MSLAKLVFPSLAWAELWEILSFLTLHELWILGSTCRSGFVTFLREKAYRSGLLGGPNGSLRPNPARFLSKLSQHEKVLLVSYPRSGNSYVRKIMEAKSGIVTGSDSRPNRTLAISLLKYGYCGEGITDQSVWLVKSHFPERMGFIRFPVKRIILVVRNPFDAIESYFHMGMTNTHDKTLSSMAFQSINKVWKEFVENEAKAWTEFHRFWLEKCDLLPILIIRYEDLLANEQLWTERMTEFILQGKTPSGMKRYWERQCGIQSTVQSPGYRPKANKSIGKALRKLTVHQVEHIEQRTKEFMQSFGYQINFTNTIERSQLTGEENAAEYFSVGLLSDRVVSPMTNCSSSNNNNRNNAFMINDNISIRTAQDKFGRKIFEIRQQYTNNDKTPFETA